MTPQEQIDELKTLLPVLDEKVKAGLILPDSIAKARSLIDWHERSLRGGKPLNDKQCNLVGRLIYRAKTKKSQKANLNVTVGADADAVAKKVMEQVQDMLSKHGGVDPEAVAEAVLGRVDGKFFKRTVDDVVKMLDERVARRVEIVVQQPDKKPIKLKDEPRHCQFEKLLRAAATKLPSGYAPGIFLQGEASSGKTTGSSQVADALGLKWYFNGAISMSHEMLGFVDGHGTYHTTAFREAYEKGGVYTFDEVDRSDPVALLAVNPHLAGTVATFPDKQVKRHKDCVIICTANTWGLGADANYSGATKLDAAFLSRFPVRINWDIDEKLEDQIVGNEAWLVRVRQARATARLVGLKVMIDTRVAQAGAALIKSGFTIDEAAEMTYLANLKPAQRQQLGVAA